MLGRKKESTATLCLLIKELINFFSPHWKVPKWVWNFRKCQEVMQSITMELKKKKPKENKAYVKLCQQLAALMRRLM